MPEDVPSAQANTETANTQTDTKTSEQTLLSAGTQDKSVTPESKDGTSIATEPAKQEGDNKSDDKSEVKGAPEKYEFKTPEGIKLDEESVSELSTVAKELNLPNDKAQRFVDMAVKHTQKIEKAIQAKQAEAWADARTKWVAELKADKEIGGANFEKSKEQALRAVRYVGIPELKEVFDSGWGDHPALVKAFAKFGKAISEDEFVDGDNSPKDRSAADVMYGKK